MGGRPLGFGRLSCTVVLAWSCIKVDIFPCEFSLFSVRLGLEKVRSFLPYQYTIEFEVDD